MNVLFKEISPDHSVMAGSCHSLTLDYFWTKLNWKVCSSHNQVSIQSTAPDQRQYNAKHPETQAALSSAPTRFPVQPMAQEGWNSSSSGTNLTGRGPKGCERFSTSAKRPLQRERPPGCRQHVPGPYSEHPCCCPNSKCCLNTCCFWVGMITQHTLNPKNTRRNRTSENTHTKGKRANSHPPAASPCGVLLLPYTLDPHGRKRHTGNLRKTLPKAAFRRGAAPSLAAHTPNHHHGALATASACPGAHLEPPGLASPHSQAPAPAPAAIWGPSRSTAPSPPPPGQGFTERVWRETDSVLLFVGPHTYAWDGRIYKMNYFRTVSPVVVPHLCFVCSSSLHLQYRARPAVPQQTKGLPSALRWWMGCTKQEWDGRSL